MTISAAGTAELAAQECATAWLVLLTLEHPGLDQPIRVTSDAVATTSNGHTFQPFPFEVTLPDDVEGRAPQAQLRIDNTSQEIIALLRADDAGVPDHPDRPFGNPGRCRARMVGAGMAVLAV